MEPSSLVSPALAVRFFTTSMTWKAPLQKKRRKINSKDHIQSVSSVAQSYMTLWDTMDCSTPGFPVHHQLPELAQIHVHWIGDAIQPSHPVLSSPPPSLNLSQHQGLFQSVLFQSVQSVLHISWPEYWSISISFSNEYSRLISFMIDRFDLIAVQGTLKSLLQCHSLKASVLQYSGFFLVQLTSIHDYWRNHNFD